jgi:hypothetical protein
MIGDLLVAPSFMVANHLQIAELTTYPTLLASEKLGNTTDVMSPAQMVNIGICNN